LRNRLTWINSSLNPSSIDSSVLYLPAGSTLTILNPSGFCAAVLTPFVIQSPSNHGPFFSMMTIFFDSLTELSPAGLSVAQSSGCPAAICHLTGRPNAATKG